MPSQVVFAEMTLLHRLLPYRTQWVIFSQESLRIETRRMTILAATGIESLQDLAAQHGWFASTLTIQPIVGKPLRIKGLKRKQTSRLLNAIAAVATESAATVAAELVAADEALCRLSNLKCYARRGAMLTVHKKLVSAIDKCCGLIDQHLSATECDVQRRLEDLRSVENIEALRYDINQRFVYARRPHVETVASAVLSTRVTDEQADAVATDEKVTLVLAGAGTGKTTVVVTKIAHLVHNEGVDPKQILVLAFNKKAQAEIRDRLTKELSAVDVATFHAFGRRVVADCEQTQPNLSKMATDEKAKREAIEEYLKELTKSETTYHLVTSYLNYHFESCQSPFDFETDADYENHWRNIELRTLSGVQVKSIQELQLANYLTEHGIEFEYEPQYEHSTATRDYRQYYPDFFLLDSGIYIEHFALNEDGNPPPHWESYAEGVAWKRKTHERYGTTLIETYSWEHTRDTWRESLREKLEATGVVLTPIPRHKLLALLSEKKISRLTDLLATFHNHVKTANTELDVLRARARLRRDAPRSLAFIDIFALIQHRYEECLAAADERDFHDFINRATRYIGDRKWKPQYRYVLVDEFQDISAGRMALLRAFNETDVGYFLVGDDWQSIYRFTGSDVSLMSGLGDQLGHVQQRTLTLTFRYNDGILEPSTKFIKANPQQTQRLLRSNGTARDDGITVVAVEEAAKGVREAVREINRIADTEEPEMIVLGRYTDSRHAVDSFVKFNTVHSAKGTEADYVIVVDLVDRQRGFPSQFADDTLLELVLPPQGGNTHVFAEERRLFYVALTRARCGTYLITDRKFPSKFVVELLEQNAGLRQIGEFDPTPPCPKCPTGHLVISSTKKTLRCINHPRCSHQAQRCTICSEGYVMITTSGKAACNNFACKQPYDVCPSCGEGVMYPRHSKKTGDFEACTEFRTKLKCEFTRNIQRKPR